MAFERPRYGGVWEVDGKVHGDVHLAIDSVLMLDDQAGLRFARVQTAGHDGMQGQRLGLQALYEEPEVAIERYDAEGFDIVEEMKKRSDDLIWVRARAIDAEKVNENGDYFPWDEFVKVQAKSKSDDAEKIPAYKTFEGCHIFTNHKNDDVEKSHGQVVFAELDEENKCIWCTFYIDAAAYPQLARGIREGYITDVSMGCFPTGELVLTTNGYKPIEEVLPSDSLVDANGNITKIRNKQEVHYSGPLVEISIQGGPTIRCTPNHPLYRLKVQDTCLCGCGEVLGDPVVSWKRYERRFKKGHHQNIFNSMVIYSHEDIDEINRVKGQMGQTETEVVEAGDLSIGDYLISPIGGTVLDTGCDGDLARLIGYFLAEGSFSYGPTGNRTQAQFCFSITEYDTLATETKGIIEQHFGVPAGISVRDDRNTATVYASSSKLVDFLYENCGSGCAEKKLRPEMLFSDPESQRHLIGAWLSGDGFLRVLPDPSHPASIVGTTVSPTLANQLSFILNRLGIYHRMETVFDGRYASVDTIRSLDNGVRGENGRQPYYNLNVGSTYARDIMPYCRFRREDARFTEKCGHRATDHHILRRIKSINRVDYDGPVYNFEVESDDHSYVVDGIVSQNCQVQWSTCSICENKAESEKAWCGHLKEKKGKRFSGTIDKGSRKGQKVSNELVYEINHDIKFIELSVVGDGAFKGCEIEAILPHTEIIARIASLRDKTSRLDRLLTSGLEDSFARYASVLTVDDLEQMDAIGELQGMLNMAEQMTGTLMERSAQWEGQQPTTPPTQVPARSGGNLLDTLTNVLNKMEAVIISLLERKDQIDLKHVQNLSKSMAETQQTMSDMIDDGIGQEPGGGAAPPPQAPQAAQQPGAPPQQPSEYTSAGGVGSMMGPAGVAGQPAANLSAEPFQVSPLTAIPGAVASVIDLDDVLRVFAVLDEDDRTPVACAEGDNESRGGLKMANSINDYTAQKIMQRRAAKVKQSTEVATDDDRYRVIISSDGSVEATIDGQPTNWDGVARITDEDIQDIRDERLPAVAQRLLGQFVKDASSGRVATAMAEMNAPKTTVQEHQIEDVRTGNPKDVQEHQLEGEREGNPDQVQEHQIEDERKGNPVNVQEHQVEVMREGNPTMTQEQQLEAVRKGVDEDVQEHRLENRRASASPDRVISATIDGISRAVCDSLTCPSDVLEAVHRMAQTPDVYSAKIVAAATKDGFRARRASREQVRCNMRTATAETIESALMGRMADVLYNDPSVEVEDVVGVLTTIASEPVDRMMGFVEKRVQKIAADLDHVPEPRHTERDRGQSLRGALYAEIAKDDDGQMDVESVEAAIGAIAETAYATTMMPTDMFRVIAGMEDGPTVAAIEAAKTDEAVATRRSERESRAWWAAIGMVKESSNANRQVADLLVDNLADMSVARKTSSIKIWKAAKKLAEGKRQAHQLVTRAVAARVNSDDMGRNAIDMTSRQEQTFTVTLAAEEVGVDPASDGFEDAVRDKTISFLQASNHQVDPNTFQFTELDISPDGMVTGTIRSSTTKRTSGDRLNAAQGGDEAFEQGLGEGFAATESLMSPMALQRRRNIREAMVRAAQGMPPPPGGGGAPPGGGPGMPPGMGDAGPGLSSIAPPGEDPMGDNPEEPGGDMDKTPSPGDVKPIGTVCPSCGSLDTKLAGGDGECQDCGAKYKVKVSIEDINVPEPGGKAGPAEAEGGGEEPEGLGAMTAPGAGPMAGPPPGAPPAGGPGAGMPMAASIQWYSGPEQFIKVAEFKESGMRNAEIPGPKPAGMLCVLCGNHDVETIDGAVHCTVCNSISQASVKASRKHAGWLLNEVKVLLG